ncbi:MAG: hypothetical protein GY839_21760 [candidate division Zixibacteria bacterium]|nr:hypothetical protein [candidate division Zixibacteria bacterium]
MKRFDFEFRPFGPIFAIIIILLISPCIMAQQRLTQIESADDLIGGAYAESEIGDYLLKNNEIEAVISDLGHQTQYTNTGGHIIDLVAAGNDNDLLNSTFTYFDNSFPNQGNYDQIEIINDGLDGNRAILRFSGVYSENSDVEVITEYSLDAGESYVTIQTWLVNNSGAPLTDFGLGDALQWGGTDSFAPGYGFDLNGVTTTSEWMAGKGDGVSYAFTRPSGPLTGPNGGGWSDPVSYNADIPVGDTATYTRYITVGSGDIASAVDAVYEIRNVSTGTINGLIVDAGSLEGLDGVTVNIGSDESDPYSQIETDAGGEFSRYLPEDDYHLAISKFGYPSVDIDTTVINDQILSLYIELGDTSSNEGPVSDTVSYIMRPLSNIPSIVRRDDSFTIQVDADQITSNWQADLTFENLEFDLTIESSVFDSELGRWFIEASFPPDIPIELYDLRVTADGLIDTVESAVKTIADFKSDFYFVHITDTHLPTHTYHDEPGGLTDTSSMIDVWTLIHDFEIINPEFVLHTGDLVNEGELEDYLDLHTFSRAKNLMASFTVPVYIEAGNHDLGGWDDTPPPDGTSRLDWWKIFGWRYLNQTSGPGPFTQDYYFDYGDIRFIGLEAYNNYDGWRYDVYGSDSFIDEQIIWLNSVITDAGPSMSIALFDHMDFQDQLNLLPMGIDLNLYGHIHRDEGSIDDYPYSLATDQVTDGARSFRLIHYDDEGFHPQPTYQAGAGGSNFTINYSPANNGLNDTVTATITNTYNFTFEHGQVVFKMPPECGYIIDNGELWQTITLESLDLCYVEIPITANAVTTVTIIVDPESSFVPGDANGDGIVLGSDVTYLIAFFRGINPPPDPLLAGDANGDCFVIGSDVTYLVSYFRGIVPTPVAGDCE